MSFYLTFMPEFFRVLDRLDGLLDKVESSGNAVDVLHARLAPDMFPAHQQVAIAAHYTVRIAYGLAGRKVPPTEPEVAEVAALRGVVDAARQHLHALGPADFAGADTRLVHHQAGFAQIQQVGQDFLREYGWPNIYFHVAMAYAILRAEGVALGKGDFDGIHVYPQGFGF